MRWSLKIGRLAGIDIFIHATFPLLILFVAWDYWQRTQSLSATLQGVALVLCVFVCIVLHEYGHALTARRYGIPTRDITLLPIGGVARLEKMPDKPIQEFWVAVAGPAVNVVIALALFLGLAIWDRWVPLDELTLTRGSFAIQLLTINIFIILFNMVPAFPMDGGRVLRALLASRMPYDKATRIAASVGQGLALIFGFLGFTLPVPLLIFIAIFVWIGAAQENSAAAMETGLQGLTVHDAMMTEFQTLDARDNLGQAVELTLAGTQHDFPVLEDGRFIGILTQKRLMAELAQHGREQSIQSAVLKQIPRLAAADPVKEAIPALNRAECGTLPVFDGSNLVGLLNLENLGELLMIRSALHPADDTGFLHRSG